jgi:hypothetical protein
MPKQTVVEAVERAKLEIMADVENGTHPALVQCFDDLHSFADVLRNHRPLLMNYFKARKQFSSGVVEGLNNKAKVTMRRSYGFRTFRVLELALYHTLGKLPEPELTHEFF